MALVTLPVLLCVIPLTWLAAAVLPLRRKPIALALGGLSLTVLTGGAVSAILTAVSVCAGWLTVRLLPLRAQYRRRCAVWGQIGGAIQLLLLAAGVLLLPEPVSRLPLLLCVMQSLDCIRLRSLGQLHIPALSAFFSYQLALPRLFCGPVQSYPAAEAQMRECAPSALSAGRGALHCTLGLMQCVLLSAPMFTLRAELTAQRAAVSALDTWLLLLIFYCAVYYAVRGLAEIGCGLAALCGYTVPEPFRSPLAARSLTDFAERWLTWCVPWCRRVLLRDGLPLDNMTYFLRMLLFFSGTGFCFRPGLPVFVWAVFFAAAFTCGRMLRLSGAQIPHLAGRILAALVILLGSGLLQAETVTAGIGMLRALAGANGFFVTGAAAYLLKIHWVPLLCAVVGLLPLGHAAGKLQQKSRFFARAGAVLIPLTELAVLLLCITELMRKWAA